MSILLLLNHNFVASTDAEAIITQKKSELKTLYPSSQIDQYLLSNIVLEKVSLTPNHYDFIYYLDSNGFNNTIPNHPAIKQSLKLQTVPISLKPSTGSKVGSKLSKLRFKKLAKTPSPSPSLPDLTRSPPSTLETQKKLRYFSDDSDDDELINEDELVESSILNSSSIICLREPSTGGVKRRRACKDCTCGLAEKEAFAFGETTEEPVEKPRVQFSSQELSEIDFTIEGKTGGCGSCSLGDAFRCDGCPFLGLPAFQPGQAITLDGIDDDL